jgi:hypothetical protein
LRPQDSIPFLRRVSADLQKNDAARHLIASLDPVDASSPVSEFRVGGGADDVVLSSSPGHISFASASPGNIPEVQQAESDLFDMREHTFVKTTFSKRPFIFIEYMSVAMANELIVSSRQLSGVHGSCEKGRCVVLPL